MQLSLSLTLGAKHQPELVQISERCKDLATSTLCKEGWGWVWDDEAGNVMGQEEARWRVWDSPQLWRGERLARDFSARGSSELCTSWLLRLWEKQGIVKTGFVAMSGTSSSHRDSKHSFWCGRTWCLCHRSPLPSLWKIHHTTSLCCSKNCFD